MNRRLWLAAATATLALTLVPGGRAGAADELTIRASDTKAGSTKLTVTVPASVIDGPVPKGAWTVLESGRARPAVVTGLPTDPIEVVLTIDTSGSMRGDALTRAKAAATSFLGRLPAAASVAIVGFGDRPYLASGFTKDRDTTRVAIAGLQAEGETAFFDAITESAGLFGPGADHAIVALTDGKDTASFASLDNAAAAVRDRDASYFGIALTGASESDLSAVQKLAAGTGGESTTADRPNALDGAYAQIAGRISGQYDLTVSTVGSGSHEFVVQLRDGDTRATGSVRVNVLAPRAEPTTRPVTPPAVETGQDPGFLESSLALWVGLGIMFAGLLIGLALAFSPGSAPSQLAAARIQGVRNRTSMFSNLGEQATQIAERSLAHKDRAGRLERALARAGIAMRPSEFAVLAATATFATFALFLLLTNPLVALIAAAVVPLLCRSGLTHLGHRRGEKFQDQLEQTLPLMAGSLRAGFGLAQAFDAVARESESPTAEEFHRLVVEIRLGRDVTDGMASLADRVRSEDFDWLVQAIDIHRQVGGDLAEVLDNVHSTIRDRNKIRRQIKALSAEGRLSGLILFILPFAMVGVISILNPSYLGELTSTGLGVAMVLGGLVLLALGGLWLRRIVRLVF